MSDAPAAADGQDSERWRGRIDEFLGEFRIIVPGLAALLGFQLTSAFSQAFDDLHPWDRYANLGGVLSSALALLFLLVPASYHRFSPRLEQSERFIHYARRHVGVAFVFMPISIALSLYVQAVRTFGDHRPAAALGGAFLLTALLVWWLLPWRRARSAPSASRVGGGPPGAPR